MNNIINKVELSKHSNVGTLSSTETNFSLYKDNVIEFNKTVDRPNDYYVEGDLIHFTIKMKQLVHGSIRRKPVYTANHVMHFWMNGLLIYSAIGLEFPHRCLILHNYLQNINNYNICWWKYPWKDGKIYWFWTNMMKKILKKTKINKSVVKKYNDKVS